MIQKLDRSKTTNCVFWFLFLTFDTATRVTDLKQSHERNGSPLLPCCLSASSRLSLATRRRSSIRSEAPSMTEKAQVDGMKTMAGKVCSESKREWADYAAGQAFASGTIVMWLPLISFGNCYSNEMMMMMTTWWWWATPAGRHTWGGGTEIARPGIPLIGGNTAATVQHVSALCRGVQSFTWFTPLRFSWCVGCRSWTVPSKATPLLGLGLCRCSWVEEQDVIYTQNCASDDSYQILQNNSSFYFLSQIDSKWFFFLFFSSRGMLVQDLEQQNNPAIEGITPHSQSALWWALHGFLSRAERSGQLETTFEPLCASWCTVTTAR